MARHGEAPLGRGAYDPTSLEKVVGEALAQLRLRYIAQFPTRTGFLIDFALPDVGVALEVDGPWHDTPEARKRDHFRDIQLRREGWRPVHIHHTSITADTDSLTAVLRILLGP